MRVAILQPTYWARCHVWNRVLNVDVYVWLDDVKFSRSATKWEDRTVIEGRDQRPIVLRLPLRGSRNALWRDAGVNEGWKKHARTISQCYSRSGYWKDLQPAIDAVYGADAATIEEVCWRSFQEIRRLLRPKAEVVRSSDLGVASSKGALVLDLVKAVGGTRYLSGAPGASYLPLEDFAESGIAIDLQDYVAPVTKGGLANPSVLHAICHAGVDGAVTQLSGSPIAVGSAATNE